MAIGLSQQMNSLFYIATFLIMLHWSTSSIPSSSFTPFAAAQSGSALGNATFYTPPYVPSSCFGFDKDQFPAGNLFAAASEYLWNDRKACGKHFRVSCVGGTNLGVAKPCKPGSVIVRIVDKCPSPGCQGTLDLSAEAFKTIADPNAGKVMISYIE
ncbi:hypothetical protein O6H91_19G031200 [Diphasiastrum complanatum]|uniref:Uncharacterized protein n=1 Tax=Diphasiastrum complanatum TaxID=34168 RepID=A0ACC2ATT7_DIPCM|nr:hypothetical protein O6H91_19G031200 [Diphasiastrum complanatum]